MELTRKTGIYDEEGRLVSMVKVETLTPIEYREFLLDQMLESTRKGQKIALVKYIRLFTKLDLKDAKALADMVWSATRQDETPRWKMITKEFSDHQPIRNSDQF